MSAYRPGTKERKSGCEEINLNMHRLSSFFNVILRQVAPFWRRTFEGPNTILGLLHKATLLVFDGLTKERCIAADLVAKEVYRLRRKSGLLFTALYLKQCSSALQKADAGDPVKGLSPFPVSLTRSGYPRIIPAFHRDL